MIEKLIFDFLSDHLSVPVTLEHNNELKPPYVLIEKTGSSMSNQLPEATFAIQSYSPTMYGAAELNDKVIKEMLYSFPGNGRITTVDLNSDYNFTDTSRKEYRYQAVFSIGYYR